ncbi:MAG: hypothetical protein U0228_21620 [Myxococcaceae bacterium]
MRAFIGGLALLVAASGCVMPRSMVVGKPAEVLSPPTNAAVVSWSLGRVDFAYTAVNANGIDATSMVDSTKLEAQVVERLRATLASQQPLGWREKGGEVSVTVEVKLDERMGFGHQAGVAYAAEAALGLGGGLIGALIGASVAGAQPPTSPGRAFGFTIGLGVGTGVGLHLGVLAALLFELNGMNSTWEGRIAVWRDGRIVGERVVKTKHRFDSNAFFVASKLATASGQGLAEFEAELLPALSALLAEVSPGLTPTPMP